MADARLSPTTDSGVACFSLPGSPRSNASTSGLDVPMVSALVGANGGLCASSATNPPRCDDMMRRQQQQERGSSDRSTGRSLRSRRRNSRGAVLVEAAIVAPLFFVMVFGVLEYGMAFYARLTVQNMSLNGARTASAAGDDLNADFRILREVNDSRTTLSTGSITHVIVYKASGPNDSVPTGCLAASSSGVCNRYTGSDLVGLDEDDFKCDDSSDLDRAWCPHTRSVVLASPGPDYIGIYVRATHDPITGFFGDEFVFTTDTVMRLEPRRSR